MVLELKNIEKSFGEKKVLTRVSFKAEGGKVFCCKGSFLWLTGAPKWNKINLSIGVIP